jgi:hypothetical protein
MTPFREKLMKMAEDHFLPFFSFILLGRNVNKTFKVQTFLTVITDICYSEPHDQSINQPPKDF